MKSLDKYLIYSSIFALFTEGFTFHYIIDWKLFYFILITNLGILAYKNCLIATKNMLIIFSFLLIHGLVMFLIFRNPIVSLFAQIIGILLSSFYYFNFLRLFKTEMLFNVYINFAFYLALIAIPMFYLNINLFTPDRLNGIMLEPAHYAAIMFPAIYITFRKKMYYKLTIILFTILLSKSSVGYIGLLLMLILPILKVKYFLKYSIIVVTLLCVGFYYLYNQWNIPLDESNGNPIVRRVKQTQESLEAIHTGKFKKYTNLSSYALLSNIFISKNIFLSYPLGIGLGSYKYEYDKVYPLLSPPEYLVKQKLSKINKLDANSLFLRLLADLGVFGVILLSYFIYRSYKIFKNDNKIIEQGAFFYLAVKLIREGHYFPPEFYFFLLLFIRDFNDENITYS